MLNPRLSSRLLSDNSKVHAVKFEALNADMTKYTVTLECYSEAHAALLLGHVDAMCAFAETDPTS